MLRHDGGGRAAAILSSLAATCGGLGIDPFADLRDVLDRVCSHPARRIAELGTGLARGGRSGVEGLDVTGPDVGGCHAHPLPALQEPDRAGEAAGLGRGPLRILRVDLPHCHGGDGDVGRGRPAHARPVRAARGRWLGRPRHGVPGARPAPGPDRGGEGAPRRQPARRRRPGPLPPRGPQRRSTATPDDCPGA